MLPSGPQANSQNPLLRALASVVALFSGEGARAGYLAAMDQGLISLSNFLATLLIARNASPTELGVYGVGFTILRLVRAIQDGITIQPMNTYGAAMDDDAFRNYATSTSIIQISMSILSAASAAVLGWVVTRLGNDTAGPAIFSLWAPFLFWQLQEYLRRLLYARDRVRGAMLNTILANAVRLALMIWWIGQDELTGIAGLQAIALGSLVALPLGLWQTRLYWSRRFARLDLTWRLNWNFGRWIMGGNLANWVAVDFYPILTAGMISFAAAGAYRALQNLVAPIHLLLRAIDTFLTPRAAKIYDQAGRPALERTLRLTYLAAGLPVLGVLVISVLFAEPLLRLLYGETYVAYSSGLVLMAIFYAVMYLYWPIQTALKATHISRPIFIANLAAILAMFTAGIWMIQRWGVYGTIAGQTLNALVVAIVLWWSWSKVRRVI